MSLHLIKLCVGVDSLEDLEAIRRARDADPGGRRWITTRMTPKRADAILDGGSLYWVIRGVVRARQKILALEAATRPEDGSPCCRIVMDETVIRTEPRPHRPFQGWRYLEDAKAPRDLAEGSEATDMPAEMAEELRTLGLL